MTVTQILIPCVDKTKGKSHNNQLMG